MFTDSQMIELTKKYNEQSVGSMERVFCAYALAREFDHRCEWPRVVLYASEAISCLRDNTQYRANYAYLHFLMAKYWMNQIVPGFQRAQDYLQQALSIYKILGRTIDVLIISAYQISCLITSDNYKNYTPHIEDILRQIAIEDAQLNSTLGDPAAINAVIPKNPELKIAYTLCQAALAQIYYAEHTENSITLANQLTNIVVTLDAAYADPLLLSRAQINYKKGSLAEGKKDFIAIKPTGLILETRFIYHYEFGHCLWQLGEVDNAITQLHEALKICPPRTELYYIISMGLAVCHAQRGDISTAMNFVAPLQTFLSSLSNPAEDNFSTLDKLEKWRPRDEVPLVLQPMFDLMHQKQAQALFH